MFKTEAETALRAARAEGAAAERERISSELGVLYAEIQRLAAMVPTESETRVAFEAERAKARAAERESIRMELLAEAERVYPFSAGLPCSAPDWAAVVEADVLRDLARWLEAPRDAFAGLDHGDLPGECPAILWHGPGHQSRVRCQVRGPHVIHEATYGSREQFARWEGERAFTGFSNEPPPEPRRQEKPR